MRIDHRIMRRHDYFFCINRSSVRTKNFLFRIDINHPRVFENLKPHGQRRQKFQRVEEILSAHFQSAAFLKKLGAFHNLAVRSHPPQYSVQCFYLITAVFGKNISVPFRPVAFDSVPMHKLFEKSDSLRLGTVIQFRHTLSVTLE